MQVLAAVTYWLQWLHKIPAAIFGKLLPLGILYLPNSRIVLSLCQPKLTDSTRGNLLKYSLMTKFIWGHICGHSASDEILNSILKLSLYLGFCHYVCYHPLSHMNSSVQKSLQISKIMQLASYVDENLKIAIFKFWYHKFDYSMWNVKLVYNIYRIINEALDISCHVWVLISGFGRGCQKPADWSIFVMDVKLTFWCNGHQEKISSLL